VSFDFHGLRALKFCSLRSQLFLKEKIKTEKNKKESLLKRAVQDGLSRFLSEKILPERWRFF
jgi:hypothetical protein